MRILTLKIKEQLLKPKSFLLSNEIAAKIFKNTSWLISGNVLTMLVGIFVTAMVARYFGPEKYGLFNYALSFTALFTALSTLGLDTLTVKAIVDKEHDEGTILCTSLYLRVFGGLILTIVASTFIRLIEPNDIYLHTLVLIMSLTILFKSLEVIDYWVQAYQRAKISSVVRIVVTFLSAGLKILMVLLEGSLIHYALIFMFDAVVIGFALYVAYLKQKEDSVKWNFSLGYAKKVLQKSWYLILSGLMVTLYMKIDQVMLGSMMPTKAELGIYSVAVRIATMWFFVPMAIITSFNPVIMNKKKSDQKAYIQSVQLLYTIVAWIGIGFGVLISLFSNTIVSVLFGLDYLRAGGILSLSIWAGTFAMLGSARGSWLICEGLQKFSIVYIGAGAVINILLNYILIPYIGGYGAATATLASQITVALIAPYFFQDTRMSSIMMLKAFKFEGVIHR